MSYETVFNTGNVPVVIDDDGRVLGGGEWGAVKTDEPAARALLDSGVLIRTAEVLPGNSVSDRAREAFERTRAARERGDRASELDKDELLERLSHLVPDLVAALPLGGDGKPSKADLVELVTDNDLDLAAAPDETPVTRPPRTSMETAADVAAEEAAVALENTPLDEVTVSHVTDLPVADVPDAGEHDNDAPTDQPKTRRGGRRGATQED